MRKGQGVLNSGAWKSVQQRLDLGYQHSQAHLPGVPPRMGDALGPSGREVGSSEGPYHKSSRHVGTWEIH